MSHPIHFVVLTDSTDSAASELHASVIAALGDATVRVEPIALVQPMFSIVNTNYALRRLAEVYPPGTVFSVTVSPGRALPMSVVGRTVEHGHTFIGGNTGAFDWLTRDFGCSELYDLARHFRDGSSAFAGRYKKTAIAAAIARGGRLADAGDAVAPSAIARLELRPGTVVEVDRTGGVHFIAEHARIERCAAIRVLFAGREVRAVRDGERDAPSAAWVFGAGPLPGVSVIRPADARGGSLPAVSVGDQLAWQPEPSTGPDDDG